MKPQKITFCEAFGDCKKGKNKSVTVLNQSISFRTEECHNRILNQDYKTNLPLVHFWTVPRNEYGVMLRIRPIQEQEHGRFFI